MDRIEERDEDDDEKVSDSAKGEEGQKGSGSLKDLPQEGNEQ